MLAVPAVLWVVTKNSAWAFALAVILQLGTIFKWGLPILEVVVFFLLVLVGIVFILQKKVTLFKRLSYGMLAMAIIAFFIVAIMPSFNTPKQIANEPETETSTEISTVAQHTTWKMTDGDYGNNRWFTDGVVEIKNAESDAEAASAANVWLEKVKTDPNLLVGAAKYLLNEDIDKATLTDSDGWATDEAVQLVARMQMLLGQSKITTSNAPATGYNSGVENNSVVASSNAGVTGDTKAVQVVTTSGETVWIMARCGNIVTPGKPSVPPGKTDNPTPPTPTPLTPKSSDPKDYKQPGDDSTTDSGIGTKPPVTVTTPAESTPPTVITSQTSSVGIVDTPTNKPGSETGVIAPGAVQPTSSASSTPIPSPEPGVNPTSSSGVTNSGINTGDPGNPF